ncbi:Transmembrane protein 205 [Exaiptasia diaphana]|nr:Transmembrane protein 205 [Exaiptasia diaphana]
MGCLIELFNFISILSPLVLGLELKLGSSLLLFASGLLVSLLCGVLNCFVFEPNATRLWMDRFAFEKERGFGNEIGPIKDKDLLSNQKYKALTHAFAKYHGMSSLATVFSFIGGLVHLWYLTCHLIT